MATPNRASRLAKLFRVLKKSYALPVPAADRPVLQQLLFASCLENARFEPAEQALAVLATTFFDWNEVRVSTISELSEVTRMLPEPEAAAARLKKVLQSVFEATYSFDLEALKKQNLGQAVARLKKIDGTTPFTVAYVTQTSLGGHAIPLDRGVLQVLCVLGMVTEDEVRSGIVAGIERAIAKSKGVEFAAVLHELGADFVANRYSPALHKFLLEIAPDAKDRLPKRPAKKPHSGEPETAARPPVDAPQKTPAAKKPVVDTSQAGASRKSPPDKKALASGPSGRKPAAAALPKQKPR